MPIQPQSTVLLSGTAVLIPALSTPPSTTPCELWLDACVIPRPPRCFLGGLDPTPADNLPIRAGIQPAELRHNGAVPWSLDTCSIQRSPVHRVQMHGTSNRHPFVPVAQHLISSSNNMHAAHWANRQWNAERTDHPTRLRIFIPDTGTPRSDPPKKSLGPA